MACIFNHSTNKTLTFSVASTPLNANTSSLPLLSEEEKTTFIHLSWGGKRSKLINNARWLTASWLGIFLNAHCRSDQKLVHVWIPGAIMFLNIYETTKRCHAILERWDASKYKAFRNKPLTLAYLMFPFPAIKNVFTNRFVQCGHGYRIYLQDGETSAQNSAGQGLETFYGAPREGSRTVWRHRDVTLRTWVGESPWVLARSTVSEYCYLLIFYRYSLTSFLF